MESKCSYPVVNKVFLLLWILGSTYIFVARSGSWRELGLGLFVSWGLGVYIFLSLRNKLWVDEERDRLYIKTAVSQKDILISEIISVEIKWLGDGAPRCYINYINEKQEKKTIGFVLWRFEKGGLQRIFSYLHEKNPKVSEIDVSKYFNLRIF